MEIREAMRQHTQGLIDFYEKLSPNAFPVVQLEFTIRSDGTVAKASATGAQGELVITRKLRRETNLKFFGRLAPCVVAMGAYGSAHHWGRQLVALVTR